jgi:hypothetical protein
VRHIVVSQSLGPNAEGLITIAVPGGPVKPGGIHPSRVASPFGPTALSRTASPASSAARQLPLMLPAISKMGRYIATTMPPMTVPRKTIMIGSIKLVMAATATSTSSS